MDAVREANLSGVSKIRMGREIIVCLLGRPKNYYKEVP